MSDFSNLMNRLPDDLKAEVDLEADLICKLVEAREEKGITQEQLAEMTGLKQSVISRLETMSATPQIDTMIKILTPLGYKLAIVPSEQRI